MNSICQSSLTVPVPGGERSGRAAGARIVSYGGIRKAEAVVANRAVCCLSLCGCTVRAGQRWGKKVRQEFYARYAVLCSIRRAMLETPFHVKTPFHAQDAATCSRRHSVLETPFHAQDASYTQNAIIYMLEGQFQV